MKKIEEMSDHEILVELLEDKRRNDKNRYIKYGIYAAIALVIIVLLIIYVPKVVAFINKYNQVLNDLQETNDKINEFFNTVGEGTAEKFKEITDALGSFLGKFGF